MEFTMIASDCSFTISELRPRPSAANSRRHRLPGSWPGGGLGSFFRQAGQAQASNEEFMNFRCLKVKRTPAKAGDGLLRVDGKHSIEFGACLVKPAEMRQRGDFDPHRCDQARLVVQGAVGPLDRLFEASRDEMSEREIAGGKKAIRIEWAQTARPLDGFDRRLGLVALRVDIPSGHSGVRRV